MAIIIIEYLDIIQAILETNAASNIPSPPKRKKKKKSGDCSEFQNGV